MTFKERVTTDSDGFVDFENAVGADGETLGDLNVGGVDDDGAVDDVQRGEAEGLSRAEKH